MQQAEIGKLGVNEWQISFSEKRQLHCLLRVVLQAELKGRDTKF